MVSLTQHDIYKRLPKVDLHRHLEGSIRLGTLQEIARKYKNELPSYEDLPKLVQMRDDEEPVFSNFLAKFQVLRNFYRSPEIIQRVTYESVADAAADGVKYLELRFAPIALSRIEGFALADIFDWVISNAEQASRDHHIMTRLIVTVNRHESVTLAEQVIEYAITRVGQGIAGFDLAGNEAEYSATPFVDVLKKAKENGLKLTVHAGEWGGAENVRQAIELLGADRIGHGVRVLEDKSVVKLARSRGTTFEVCLTSNYQSGVVTRLADHPLACMLEAGLNVTINTDDPSISRITLSDEYRIACEVSGLSRTMLNERVVAAAKAAFLPSDECNKLVDSIKMEQLKSINS